MREDERTKVKFMREILIVSDDKQLIESLKPIYASATITHEVKETLHQEDHPFALLDISTAAHTSGDLYTLLNAHIPVLVMTTTEHLERAAAYVEAGAEDYIIKPCPPALLKKRLKAIENQHLIGEFISFAAHELKSPLSSIKGYAEVIMAGMAGEINAEQKEFLQVIDSNAERLVSLIDSLRDVVAIDSGHYRFEREPLQIRTVLDEVLLHYQDRFATRQQVISTQHPDALPEIYGSELHLAQALMILIDNAHRYTPPGGQIIISTGFHDRHIQIAIADEGIGLPAADHPHVMKQHYYYANNQRRIRDIPGSGLSLYIARHIVEAHKGHIWFESDENLGTVFYVALPMLTNGK